VMLRANCDNYLVILSLPTHVLQSVVHNIQLTCTIANHQTTIMQFTKNEVHRVRAV